ncbi:hypothetical protein Dvina_31470 [Dactylosporangium vinaceum]|uniref:Uncharacterized protein n=1 Tax=Dactylosporangium vinaceum TaxID=53362 RepID=A0ABV5LZ76_9ACTN|nr:hypothetical protein [Dactylosporangium vinaceum]UAB92821.1 hypothetical protein Dvina_31470 [Dactylosporangium vinaceum]
MAPSPLDAAALEHTAGLVEELRGMLREPGADRLASIEAAVAQARTIVSTLSIALVSARDRTI